MKQVRILLKLWVFHAIGKEIFWEHESWAAKMPDIGEYDPLILQREEDGEPTDAYALFKLEYCVDFDGEKEAMYEWLPVARQGWFYKALPKFGFEKVKV